MNLRLIVFGLLFGMGVLNVSISYAQASRISISGYVEDSLTTERLIGATLTILIDKKPLTTTTNSFGYFTFSIQRTQTAVLTCSYVGYDKKSIVVDSSISALMIIKLAPEVLQEDEVIILGDENKISTNTMGQLKLSSSLIKRMPKLLGDNDPLKAMQTLPGITQGIEGTTGLIVRGGSPDQTLFLLDGVPVYNPTHLGGVFSSFNGDAIKEVTMYKGNFPARFGERLSSVIDLSTKDGNMKNLATEGSIGMLASKVLVEGPIKRDTSSFLISARRSYWDLLASPVIALTNTKEEKRNLGLYFYDINAKFNYIISPKDRVYASFFSSKDNYSFKVTTDLKPRVNYSDVNIAKMGWQNMSGSIRWNHVFSSRLFVNSTIYMTGYKILTSYYNNAVDIDINIIEEGKYRSKVSDSGFKTDFEYKLDNFQSIRFGLATSYKIFTPGSSFRTLQRME